MFLIYKEGARGPSPQKVSEIPINVVTNTPIATIKVVQLSAEEFALPLRFLEKMYPAPKVSDE